MGGNSQLLKVPSAGLDIMVMVNRHDVSAVVLTNKILDACVPDLDPDPRSSRLTWLTGVFCSPSRERVIQLLERSGKQIAVIDGTEVPCVVEENGTLRPTAPLSYLSFRIACMGDRTAPRAIRFEEFGTTQEWPITHPADALDRRVVGCYQSNGTGTQITIRDDTDGMALFSIGRFGSHRFRLECLAPGIWRATSVGLMPWGGILSFQQDGSGFRFSSLRTRALPFQRTT